MFHVPEPARVLDHPILGSTADDGNNGAFDLDSPEPGWRLAIIASDGADCAGEFEPWEHVSVHAYRRAQRSRLRSRHQTIYEAQERTPTWKEMSFVKRLFWDGDDVVMQLHPREADYINQHPYTLHLWRPVERTIPTPPSIFVGVNKTHHVGCVCEECSAAYARQHR